MYGGFRINQLIGKLLDIVNLVQRLQTFQLHLFKDILRLHSQGIAVNKEQNTLKALRLQKAVNHAQNRACFASACGHRQQRRPLAAAHCLIHRLHSLQLIIAQMQAVFILQEIIRQSIESSVALRSIFLQHFF